MTAQTAPFDKRFPSLHQPLLSTSSSSTSTASTTSNITLSSPPSTASTTTTTTTSTSSTLSRRPTFRFAHPLTYALVLFGLFCTALAAYAPTPPFPLSILQPIIDLAYWLFREQCVIQAVWWTAIGLHVGEALWVWGWMLDKKGVVAGWERMAWVMQTVMLGWGSVSLLRRLPDVRRGSRQATASTIS